MTDLKTLVQAFLDADDEFVAADQATHHVSGGWASVWQARERRDLAKGARDEAYAALRAAVRGE